MPHVFIVRPFGTKEGIDFDTVESDLIRPVMARLGLEGGTTGEIAESGNIRADMMDRLLTADLVIADISIHNANVYYELGVRHALRDRRTVLIRRRAHDVPFDLKTDRYLEYDLSSDEVAERSRDDLERTLRATLASRDTDSPVYRLIPGLEVRDANAFLVVPTGFREAVERDAAEKDLARLGVLANEAARERWRIPGLRLVGRAQFRLGAYRRAIATWEQVREDDPNDAEANHLLATCYQRTARLTESDQACRRALDGPELSDGDHAEAFALLARNDKARWRDAWSDGGDLATRQRKALESGLLFDAQRGYRDGFLCDVDHYFSGLNALSLAVVTLGLAEAQPEVWEARHDGEDEAEMALRKLRREIEALTGAVEVSLKAAEVRRGRPGADPDEWLDLAVAEHRLLAGGSPQRVRQSYLDAVGRVRSPFAPDSAARQLMHLYVDLDVRAEAAQASLDALGLPDGPARGAPAPPATVIVSTGHRIDAEDRPSRRFPAECEGAARAAIRAAVEHEKGLAKGDVLGISGLASGNDILFHEVCRELGIRSLAGLALPRAEYQRRSVQDAGPAWVERYRALCDELEVETLSRTSDPPSWVTGADDSYVFQRSNLWILERAFATGEDARITLIALWNRQGGDGPGGTADMVDLAESRGAKVVILDTRELFGPL